MRSSIILPLALAAAAVGVVATPTPFEYYQARLSAIEKPFRPEHHVKISLYVMSRCPDAVSCLWWSVLSVWLWSVNVLCSAPHINGPLPADAVYIKHD